MIEGEDIAVRRILAYAMQRDLRLVRRLGSGIHGVVFEAESNAYPGLVAVKAHRVIDGSACRARGVGAHPVRTWW